jgi:hypothetical protein
MAAAAAAAMNIKRKNVLTVFNILLYGTCLLKLKSPCQIQATDQE